MTPIGPFSEPIPTDVLKKVAEVVASVQISDIRLVKLSSILHAPPPDDGLVEVELGHDIKASVVGDDVLAVLVHYSLIVKASAKPETDLLNLSATFQLMYKGKELNSIDRDKWMAFANVNAVHNSWPYLRELVQSISGRMGVPALTVPLLKIQPQKSQKELPAETK